MTERVRQGERHQVTFEDFRFDVAVSEQGDVTVSFHESGKCAFSCSRTLFEECVAFARRLGAFDA